MSEERNKILKLLEEGHITSDEAEKLLDAVDKGQHVKESNSKTDTDEDSFKEFKKNLEVLRTVS